MNIWVMVGIVLIMWAVFDLFTGTVWVHRKVERRYEPKLYWVWIMVYLLIGISCLFPA